MARVNSLSDDFTVILINCKSVRNRSTNDEGNTGCTNLLAVLFSVHLVSVYVIFAYQKTLILLATISHKNAIIVINSYSYEHND